MKLKSVNRKIRGKIRYRAQDEIWGQTRKQIFCEDDNQTLPKVFINSYERLQKQVYVQICEQITRDKNET